MWIFFLFGGILNNYEKMMVKNKTFKAGFIETLFTEEDTSVFTGDIIITRKRFFIDIKKPEKELIFGGDTAYIYFPEKAKAFRVLFQVPLLAAIFSPSSMFTVSDEGRDYARLIKVDDDTTEIYLMFNKKGLPGFIRFKGEGNNIHFVFRDVKVSPKEWKSIPSLPDSVEIKDLSR